MRPWHNPGAGLNPLAAFPVSTAFHPGYWLICQLNQVEPSSTTTIFESYQSFSAGHGLKNTCLPTQPNSRWHHNTVINPLKFGLQRSSHPQPTWHRAVIGRRRWVDICRFGPEWFVARRQRRREHRCGGHRQPR